ncbi:hypothetical protein KGY71_01760 [Candidatus Bipolaricaulota bacterium]|nr:hypothetical protein [Candidatus Bipolaricaulota bacterium]
MTKETSALGFLGRGASYAMIPKLFRRRGAEYLEIASTLALTLLIVSIILVLSPVPARAEGEKGSGATVEGFSLFRYEDDLAWKLTGRKANENERDLAVHDFELLVRRSGSQEGETLYMFSGEEIRLNSRDGTGSAVIPGKVKLEIQDEFRGKAESARYDFSTGKVSGTELKLTATGDGAETSLMGKSFEYGYKSEELKITEGFQVVIASSGDGATEISGEELTWTPGVEIHTDGNVVARTASGWKLSAETMSWNPEGGSLECSGSAVGVKGDIRIQGENMTYDRKEEKLRVNKARMVVKGK